MEQAQENISREEWLQQNTGWCERLRARVRPQQCENNKKRVRMMGEMEPGLKPCINCPGITPGQTMEKSKKGRKGKMTKIYCQRCNEQAENAARGLCGNCYQYLWSQGNGAEKQFQLKYAIKVGKGTKEQREPVAEPGPVGGPEPESEAELKPVQEETTQEDPLAGAKMIKKHKPNICSTPYVKVDKRCSHFYFNYQAVHQFQLNTFRFMYFYLKGQQAFIQLSNKKSKDAFKITKKVKKVETTVAVSAVAISRELELQGGELLEVKPTSREDVLKLEKV